MTAAPVLRRDQANMAPAHKASATLPRFSADTAVPGHAFSTLTLAIRRRDGANAAYHARFDTYWTPVALLPGAAWVRPDPRPADYESGSRLPCVSIVVYLSRSGAYLDCHGLQWTRMDCNPGCNSSVPAQARGPTCLVGAGKLPKSRVRRAEARYAWLWPEVWRLARATWRDLMDYPALRSALGSALELENIVSAHGQPVLGGWMFPVISRRTLRAPTGPGGLRLSDRWAGTGTMP